tara:strand:- start:185 stop:313 length:129 start_codon:yes stop_codon:yes gene_type:complete
MENENEKIKNQLKAKNIGRVIKDKNEKEEKKVEEEKNNSNEN